MRRPRWLLFLLPVCASAADAAVLTVPFDFKRGEIGFDVKVNGIPAYALLDTGVDPSAVDLQAARRMRLNVDWGAGGALSGEGKGSAAAFPTKVVGLKIAGRSYAPIEALVSHMKGMSAGYGRRIDLVLGYSFLDRRLAFVDYRNRTLSFLDRGAEAAGLVRNCRTRFEIPLGLLKGLNWPTIPAFRFGNVTAQVSLDTGSNGGIALYRSALALPGVRPALRAKGVVGHGGFRGDATVRAYSLDEPVGFGPFRLPRGQAVTVRDDVGSRTTRVANVGNRVFAAMKLKMLLDYRGRRMIFWGDCR